MTEYPPMTAEEFRALALLVRDAAGLHFDLGARERLERRLADRLKATGARDFTDYYVRLKRFPEAAAELERMLETCVTHETYFFRETRQLAALEEEILPDLVKRLHADGIRRRIRLWSAGCSTGEEPYTLAMISLRSPALRGWDVEVLGTDLSQRALQRARKALYTEGSFRGVDAALVERYFTQVKGAYPPQWEVRPEVRERVTLGRVNLWNDGDVSLVGRMDVILCRNVLIYFDRDGKRKVVDALHDRLLPGGYLLLGHSENLLSAPSPFEAVSLVNDLVYRRAPLWEARARRG